MKNEKGIIGLLLLFSVFVICILSYGWNIEREALMQTLEMHKKTQQACIDKGGIPIMDKNAPARMETCKFPEDFCKGQKQ